MSDAVPGTTDADNVWTWHNEDRGLGRRAGVMYAVRKSCMFLFLLVDLGIIASIVEPW